MDLSGSNGASIQNEPSTSCPHLSLLGRPKKASAPTGAVPMRCGSSRARSAWSPWPTGEEKPRLLAAVYGPREVQNRSRQVNNKYALVRCEYRMAEFNTGDRRRKPKGYRYQDQQVQTLLHYSNMKPVNLQHHLKRPMPTPRVQVNVNGCAPSSYRCWHRRHNFSHSMPSLNISLQRQA